MEIILKNKPEEKRKVLDALEDFVCSHQLPPKVVQAADLALEEHLPNVMSYAYEDSGEHNIVVRLEADDSQFVIEVEDDGKPFDPTKVPEVDTSAPLEKRPLGGLGIHLIRRSMDEMGYERKADRNLLRMKKRLAPAP